MAALVSAEVCAVAALLLFLQVPAAKSRLTSGDVFILDMGVTVYQWNGSGSSAFERSKVYICIIILRPTAVGDCWMCK